MVGGYEDQVEFQVVAKISPVLLFGRHYPIDGRERLRDSGSADWEQAFTSYLTDLACPIRQEGSRAEVLDWLLGLAVRLEYGEKVETFNKFTKDYVSNQMSVQQL